MGTDGTSIQSSESAKEASGYVDAIVKHDAEMASDPGKPVRRKRSNAPLLAVLIPVLVGLTAWNVSTISGERQVFSPAEEAAADYFVLLLAAQDIESFQDSAGRLPHDLAEVGLAEDSLNYAITAEGYTLILPTRDSTVSHQSTNDVGDLEAAFDRVSGREPR